MNKYKINANLSWWIIGLLAFSIILFRVLFFSRESLLFLIINDLIVIPLSAVIILVIIRKIKRSGAQPSALVLNSGIIVAFVFLVLLFSKPVFISLSLNSDSLSSNLNFYQNITLSLYSLMFLVLTSYWFATIKELYFYRRYRSEHTYFYLMIVFIVLTSVSSVVIRDEEYGYVKDTFKIITLILIVFNSLKISWIAFISKKEKISLLIQSIIISILFSLNYSISSVNSFNGKLLADFSPSFYTFYTLILLYGGIYFAVLFFTTLFHIPTAEAYDRKAKEVSSLQYFSKLINEVLDFDDLAETITDLVTKVSGADSAWIIIENNNESKTIANKNIAYVDADLINKFLLRSGVCGRIAETKICSLSKYEDRARLSEKFGSIAITPLKSIDNQKRYLITARKNDLIFFEEDKTAINTFADYASIAIENSLLLEQSIEKQRLEKELDVARDIQKRILPVKNPVVNNLSISTFFTPAFEVGGDYYDFFEIDRNKLGFVIADVSGKGISAAFIMAEIKGIFNSLSKMIDTPKQILEKVNEILLQRLTKKDFVSALYGIIDSEKEELTFARAGHCPAILIRNSKIRTFKTSGIGLGLTNSFDFNNHLEEITINLKDDDTLAFYTDGITESKNDKLEDFGEEHFSNILIEHSDKSVNEIADEVIKEVSLFSRSHHQYDDITLIILKWNKKNNSNGV
ncbi:MAG TPA: SpoIIE family protein phosphatase [Ignavibacteriaceae bacterium]|nr:SpoIIE family protein phosphatase [Ignavibacterium album]HOJ06106.1 SpoIIE family protein phosphatase [Ignavibacteriaceae bacterium]